MASGHVSRIKRPNTWLHRPMLQNVKKALANSEPSTHGTKRTCRGGSTRSALREIVLQKVENRTTLKISRKLIFALLYRYVAFQHRYGSP